MKRLSFWLAFGVSLAFLALSDVPVIGAVLAWGVLAAWLVCGAVWVMDGVR